MLLDTYFDELATIVNDFVQSFDEDYTAEMGNDFCVFLDHDVISWSVLFLEDSGESFYNNFVSRFPMAAHFNLFTLSLLHELGHLETEWQMEDDTKIRNALTNEEDYFNLFNERIATDWAGDWLENNFQEATKIDGQIMGILSKIHDLLD